MKGAVILAAAALLAPLPAQAQAACLTPAEAESLTLVAMPDVIRETGRVCATRLPANSLVRRTGGPFLAKYTAAADTAWPAARAAIVKLSDPMVDALLQSSYARPLLTSLLVPQLVGRIAPSDCGMLDRLIALLEPLPPRNSAGIVLVALQFLKAEKAKGATVAVPDLPLCEAPTR